MPTCMSAAPRRTGVDLVAWPSASAAFVRAHRVVSRPCVIRMSARAIAQPDDVGEVPALLEAAPCPRRTGRSPPRGPRSSSRPVPAALRRRPRPRSSSSATRSSARRACAHGAVHVAEEPRLSRPGRWRSPPAACGTPSSSTTTIPEWLAVAAAAVAVQPALGLLQALARRPRVSPSTSRTPAYAVAQHRSLPGSASSGSASSHRRSVASCRSLAHRRDRELDQVGRSGEVPAGHRVADRLGPFAVAARTSRSPADAARARGRAARRAGAPGARRRRGGDSDTTGAGRRAGRGTGSLDRAPPAWPCRPSWPVTASHSGPLSRRGSRSPAGSSGPLRAGAAGPPRRGSRRCTGRPRRSRR